MAEKNITELAEIVIIDPSSAVFAPEKGGYISLSYKGTEYKKVKLNRALPYRCPNEYICVSDKDGKEIGIIKTIDDFSDEQKAVIEGELDKLYYSPAITRIISAKDRMGYMYFEVETTVGKRDFAVRDASRNIKFIDPDRKASVQIRDVDGNRYIVEDFMALDSSSAKKIEPFLV
ncbi:MAG: DUF1854 domain-containing protein [Ruminococcaceae bacterium]|nr:DUF1854 domain-containing protein [Oscillospiraceae bacterium]